MNINVSKQFFKLENQIKLDDQNPKRAEKTFKTALKKCNGDKPKCHKRQRPKKLSFMHDKT